MTRDEVVGDLEVLVVLQLDEVIGLNRRVRAEQQPDLHLAIGERRDGDRTADVERHELGELQSVGLLETDQAEGTLRALRRAAESQRAGQRGSVPPLS